MLQELPIHRQLGTHESLGLKKLATFEAWGLNAESLVLYTGTQRCVPVLTYSSLCTS